MNQDDGVVWYKPNEVSKKKSSKIKTMVTDIYKTYIKTDLIF